MLVKFAVAAETGIVIRAASLELCFNKTPPIAMTATASTAMAAHRRCLPLRGVGVNAVCEDSRFRSEFMRPI